MGIFKLFKISMKKKNNSELKIHSAYLRYLEEVLAPSGDVPLGSGSRIGCGLRGWIAKASSCSCIGSGSRTGGPKDLLVGSGG